jgi:thymidylate synthase (FAD)
MDHKAQLEIRLYAETIGEKIVQKWVPIAWEAFMDYRHGSISLSNDEVEILSLLNGGRKEEAEKLLIEAGFTVNDGESVKPTLEGRELAGKMERMGITVPWGKRQV